MVVNVNISTTNVQNSQNNKSKANEKTMDTRCWYCGRQSEDLKSCSACHLAVYCSKPCQTSHWKHESNIPKDIQIKMIELEQAKTVTDDAEKQKGLVHNFDEMDHPYVGSTMEVFRQHKQYCKRVKELKELAQALKSDEIREILNQQ